MRLRRGSESAQKRYFSAPDWPNWLRGSTYLCYRWSLLILSELVSILVSGVRITDSDVLGEKEVANLPLSPVEF